MTGREAQVMDAVWRLGEATAEQVRGALPAPLHDSTVRTLLRVLEGKGYLRHQARGKTYVYRAVIERREARAARAAQRAGPVLRRVGPRPGAQVDRGRADHARAACCTARCWA